MLFLSTQPSLVNKRTLVPLRFIAEALALKAL
ncbi:stalk domain-containing protein [Thermincola ferriacetica]